MLVKNRTSFDNQKINIIKNYASLCDELNVPVKFYETAIHFQCCGTPEAEKSTDPVAMKVKKRVYKRACLYSGKRLFGNKCANLPRIRTGYHWKEPSMKVTGTCHRFSCLGDTTESKFAQA